MPITIQQCSKVTQIFELLVINEKMFTNEKKFPKIPKVIPQRLQKYWKLFNIVQKLVKSSNSYSPTPKTSPQTRKSFHQRGEIFEKRRKLLTNVV